MKFIKGQWYRYENHFWQYDGRCFRHAGDEIPVKYLSYANQLTPASLIPDFSNAKVGDECFDSAHGQGFIRTIPCDAVGHYASSFTIVCGNTTYHLDEAAMRFPVTKHPTLFNSYAQFMAYWMEEGLKMREGKDA